MFTADSLANILIVGWINRTVALAIAWVIMIVWMAVLFARDGAYGPLVLVAVVGLLIGLVIWNAIRRQRRIQREWNAPISQGRQEPYLYASPALPQTGLRAYPLHRWPVSH